MWTGSIEDFGNDARGGPWLECWVCAARCATYEALEHEEKTGHAVCEPKEHLAEHSCGCTVCVDQHDGFDLRWPGATHRGSAGGPTCAARTCHFGDVSKCTVLIIESSGNEPSWGGGNASLASVPPSRDRIVHSRGWRRLTYQ